MKTVLKSVFSILCSLLLILGASIHKNNEYTIPVSQQDIFSKLRNIENTKDRKSKRRR